MADLSSINRYIGGNIPIGSIHWDTAITYSTNLYLAALEQKYGGAKMKDISPKIRQLVAEAHNMQFIPSMYGSGVAMGGASVQAGTNIS